MELPIKFIEKMEQQLGEDFQDFLESYDQPKVSGLRANRLKVDPNELKRLLPYISESVTWTKDGFYYNESEVRPAKHPYYYAGLYYIQEPSAMYPVELLQASPRQRVLDLAAAPGGKSIQIASQIGRDGLLVVNDPHPQRAKVLLKNIERYGVVNAVVLNETPDRIRKVFGAFFDKILVDAPCSGEGMFRKEPDMVKNWNEEEVYKYANWQSEILDVVPNLLCDEGEIVYSTCTFSREENEQQINRLIELNRDYDIVETHRLWPHRVKGEGHFAAKVKRESNVEKAERKRSKPEAAPVSHASLQSIQEFSEQVWGDKKQWKAYLPKNGHIVERAGHILWESNELPVLRGLKVLRSGWLIGTVLKERFRPSQAFALGLPLEAVSAATQKLNLSADTEESAYQAIRYLKGETINLEGKKWPKGWHFVHIDGYPLGWAKGAGHLLKNEFPPGWRWED